MKKSRIDAAIYQEALAELRERHGKEFEKIRRRRLAEAGVEIKFQVPIGETRETIYRAIEVLTNTGVPPSVRNISKHVGTSTETVRHHVNTLIALGRVTRQGRGRLLVGGATDAKTTETET